MDLKNATRTESLLANIAGHTDVPVPDMKNATRSERLLKEILDNGGGGGGDVTKEYVDTAIADAVADIDDDISALSDTVADKVDKVSGKSLSTNDYTDADKALVQDSPITVTATASPISTAAGKPRKLTVYGKSEVVDGAIISAGEGWATVDLGTLNWIRSTSYTNALFYTTITGIKGNSNGITARFAKITNTWASNFGEVANDNEYCFNNEQVSEQIYIRCDTYTDATAFKTAMSGVLLCYPLADPTQGNTLAVKTDNGTGINGTMATFSTGTPLRGIPDGAKDVAEWDGSSGEVTKNCGDINLGDYTWHVSDGVFYVTPPQLQQIPKPAPTNYIEIPLLCDKYPASYSNDRTKKMIAINSTSDIVIYDPDYTNPADLKTALSGVHLIYPIATPTTAPLTQAENDSIAGLRTFAPQTHAQNNAGAVMTVEAYAGTANGQLISDMQPTRSPLLTLTTSGWNNNTQTVSYAHDIGKRNTIDVEPASIKAWTAAGILATAETASTITFECDTVPASDLSFRVTSMEVR